MADDWSWDPTLFEGAAPYYERGRLPYAPGLADAMAGALGLDASGRLLDVGCGPGTVALRLAHLFEQVVGLDPDAGMLAEAERLATERGVTNATWVRMRAEALPAGLGTFRAITFAQSFHWMEREKVASAAYSMLEPGGAVVHVDSRYQDGVSPGDGHALPAPPDAAIEALRQRYLGRDRRAGQSVRNSSPSGEAAIFAAAGFAGPEIVAVPGLGLIERDVEQIIAGVLSNSGTAPHLFGDRLPAFVSDLERLLYATSPEGRFLVRLPDNQLFIWRPTVGAGPRPR